MRVDLLEDDSVKVRQINRKVEVTDIYDADDDISHGEVVDSQETFVTEVDQVHAEVAESLHE